VKNAVCDG